MEGPSFTLQGSPCGSGEIVIGRACLMTSIRFDVRRYWIERQNADLEVVRLTAAQNLVRRDFALLRSKLSPDMPGEMGAFLTVYEMILSDELLVEAAANLIRSRLYNAEWALTEQFAVLSRRFDEVEDLHLRDCKSEVEYVVRCWLEKLSALSVPRRTEEHGAPSQKGQGVLVAVESMPAELLRLKSQGVRGFLTEAGGLASHLSIAARGLDIPAVMSVPYATRMLRPGDLLILDSEQGMVIANPSPEMVSAYAKRQRRMVEKRHCLDGLLTRPAQTRDGVPIQLCANIEFPEDAGPAFYHGAAGIGLFRTEFLFLNHEGYSLPSEESQFQAYARVVRAMQGRPVTIRTVDLGADKALPNRHAAQVGTASGENPAMGLRAIRWSLSEPDTLLTQLKAIIRAAAYGPVRILFPMLTSESEIKQVLKIVALAKQCCAEKGVASEHQILLGAMIEVPAAALAIPLFLRYFQFLSIGSNDLIQYTLATDRDDSSVAHLYNPLHPAVLRLIRHVLVHARRAQVPVALCGELAGNPLLTRLLLGMGLTEFSMPPSQLLLVKREVVSAQVAALKPIVAQIWKCYSEAEIGALVEALASF